VLALAVAGGGMRAAVSSGMCVVLEAAGLLPAFDRIYGTSAGALNGAATAAGQAAISSTHYQDAALGRVICPLRALRRRPIIDFDLMFGEVIARRRPLSWSPSAQALTSGAGHVFRVGLARGAPQLHRPRRAYARGARQRVGAISCAVTRLPSAVSGWSTVA
jgi:predicted acylesterase/phospholipase RssA